MTKTIEEAANDYAANWEATHNIHNPELYDLIVGAYKTSAERIFSLPLASRMTAEEKERVRKEYGELLLFAAIYKKKLSNSVDAVGTQFQSQNYQFYVAQIKLLETIFGADFFKEGE